MLRISGLIFKGNLRRGDEVCAAVTDARPSVRRSDKKAGLGQKAGLKDSILIKDRSHSPRQDRRKTCPSGRTVRMRCHSFRPLTSSIRTPRPCLPLSIPSGRGPGHRTPDHTHIPGHNNRRARYSPGNKREEAAAGALPARQPRRISAHGKRMVCPMQRKFPKTTPLRSKQR